MQYLSHHIGVQRLISLNSMRIIIAIFEDVPFLGLNMYLLMTQPDLASNLVFMVRSLLTYRHRSFSRISVSALTAKGRGEVRLG